MESLPFFLEALFSRQVRWMERRKNHGITTPGSTANGTNGRASLGSDRLGHFRGGGGFRSSQIFTGNVVRMTNNNPAKLALAGVLADLSSIWAFHAVSGGLMGRLRGSQWRLKGVQGLWDALGSLRGFLTGFRGVAQVFWRDL